MPLTLALCAIIAVSSVFDTIVPPRTPIFSFSHLSPNFPMLIVTFPNISLSDAVFPITHPRGMFRLHPLS